MEFIYTKAELILLPKEEIKIHREEAWEYFQKVKKIQEFMEVDDA